MVLLLPLSSQVLSLTGSNGVLHVSPRGSSAWSELGGSLRLPWTNDYGDSLPGVQGPRATLRDPSGIVPLL